MKYYKELARLGAFNVEDAAEIMVGIKNVSQQLNAMIKAGCVERIKKNLYSCVDLINGEKVADKYVIATHINENSFVSYHTAFEFYGFYNQVYYDVHVSSMKRFANFETDDNNYICFQTNTEEQVETIRGVKVTSIERTIVDSIDMLGKVMDVEELVKCLQLIHVVSKDKLEEILLKYDKEILYRKTGYILSYFAEQLNLDNSFFEFCKRHSDFSNRGKISSNEINKLVYIKEWSLYGYTDLISLTVKGGVADV